MKTIRLTCEICDKIFDRSAKQHQYNITKKNRKHIYCADCHQPRKILTEHYCPVCTTSTTNPKYCSSSCSAKENNKKLPKRQPQGKCADCSKRIRISRKYCPECLRSNHRTNWGTLTLQELYQKGSRNVYHTTLRQHSKQVATKAGLLKACKVCGYDFYVECCHIKSVSSFSKSSTLEVVNAKGNLVGLCPNHHIELDKGKIKL